MRLVLMAVALMAGMTPAMGCQLDHPAGYVYPTNEDHIVGADFAFVGKVVGLRETNGEVVRQPLDCEVGDEAARENCDKRNWSMVTGILSVDEPIHGIGGKRFFEMRRGDGGEACDHRLEIGQVYLVTGEFAYDLPNMPDGAQLAAWRALEAR